MNFNEVKNIVGEGKKVPFLLRKATNSLIFFWHTLTSIPCFVIAISLNFWLCSAGNWLKQLLLLFRWAIVVWSEIGLLSMTIFCPLALGPLVGRQEKQKIWAQWRWTVLIHQHMPFGESSGCPCRYYGWRNEAHPFPTAWRMTCGNWGLWWDLVVALFVVQIPSD